MRQYKIYRTQAVAEPSPDGTPGAGWRASFRRRAFFIMGSLVPYDTKNAPRDRRICLTSLGFTFDYHLTFAAKNT